MDIAFRNTFIQFSRRLSLRVPTLSANFKAKKRVSRPLLIGFALVLAGGSALFAYQLSRNSAWEDWEKSRAPSSLAWGHALATYGFRRILDPEEFRRASRTLPQRSDHTGAVWISTSLGTAASADNAMWILIFGDGNHAETSSGSPFQIYTTAIQGTVAPAWFPLGYGWSAFDQLIGRLDAHPPPPASPKARALPRIARDPRELLY